MKRKDVIASIVLYRNDKEILSQTISSFLNTELDVGLILIDNSPTDELKCLKTDSRITYIFQDANVGFGAAHNLAIEKYRDECDYFLVLNPDVYFDQEMLTGLIKKLEVEQDVGLIQPQVRYPDESLQKLCKRNPRPFDLFARRFIPSSLLFLFKERMHTYELNQFSYSESMYNVPYLSGCFMLFRSEVLKKVGLFDDRIFMYIEDADITRRTLEFAKTLYYPGVHIYHHFAKGSHKSLKLMSYSIHGAWIYFNKWGWFNSDPGNAYQPKKKTL